MSTHKTTADQGMILSFLKDTFSADVTDFVVIVGGEGSQAYSFRASGDEYILRINKHHTLGFRKDEYAFTHYASPEIPIPKIYKIGNINPDLRFCISEKVEGKIVMAFRGKEAELLQPALFDVLDSIHATDVSATKGYGKWSAEGEGEFASWKEHLLTVDKYAKGGAGIPSLFETTFLEKDFWDVAHARFVELVAYCPEERFLVHGDYGFNNVLSDGTKITGVIDWENSMYGDFLFDVAWLSFWSRTVDYQSLYLEHSNKKNGDMNTAKIKNFEERMLCYKLCIGLVSLSFYAYSGQREKYDGTKEVVARLLKS